MFSYAVRWQAEGDQPRAGRLEFDPQGLWLHGGSRGHEVRLEIPYEEIVGAERAPGSQIGPCRALRVNVRDRGPLLLASVAGVGALSEILDTLQRGLNAL